MYLCREPLFEFVTAVPKPADTVVQECPPTSDSQNLSMPSWSLGTCTMYILKVNLLNCMFEKRKKGYIRKNYTLWGLAFTVPLSKSLISHAQLIFKLDLPDLSRFFWLIYSPIPKSSFNRMDLILLHIFCPISLHLNSGHKKANSTEIERRK